MKGNQQLLNRITNNLLINAVNLDVPGLFYGKMGVVLYFAHLARFTGKSSYEDYAGELLEFAYQEVYNCLPVDFSSGLCGIAWGIHYLLQKGFMEGDADDILSEIDAKIMERDLRRITDLTVETGLAGIGYYIKARVNSCLQKNLALPFDGEYLTGWNEVEYKVQMQLEVHPLDYILGKERPIGDSITEWQLGLVNGSAGVGLKMIYT